MNLSLIMMNSGGSIISPYDDAIKEAADNLANHMKHKTFRKLAGGDEDVTHLEREKAADRLAELVEKRQKWTDSSALSMLVTYAEKEG